MKDECKGNHQYQLQFMSKVKRNSGIENSNPQKKFEQSPIMMIVKTCINCGKVDITEIDLEDK